MLARIENSQPREKPTMPLTWHVGFCVNDSDARSIACLRHANYEVYYPQIREMRPTPKRKLAIRQRHSLIRAMEPFYVPFWPRYFFIRFSLMDGKWHELFELAHIRGLICDEQGGKLLPAPIADEVIEGIMAMESNGAIPAKVTMKEISYKLGEKVRINAGALAGHNGIVHDVPSVPVDAVDEVVRLRLLVSLFGASRVVELALSDIEKL